MQEDLYFHLSGAVLEGIVRNPSIALPSVSRGCVFLAQMCLNSPGLHGLSPCTMDGQPPISTPTNLHSPS